MSSSPEAPQRRLGDVPVWPDPNKPEPEEDDSSLTEAERREFERRSVNYPFTNQGILKGMGVEHDSDPNKTVSRQIGLDYLRKYRQKREVEEIREREEARIAQEARDAESREKLLELLRDTRSRKGNPYRPQESISPEDMEKHLIDWEGVSPELAHQIAHSHVRKNRLGNLAKRSIRVVRKILHPRHTSGK